MDLQASKSCGKQARVADLQARVVGLQARKSCELSSKIELWALKQERVVDLQARKSKVCGKMMSMQGLVIVSGQLLELKHCPLVFEQR